MKWKIQIAEAFVCSNILQLIEQHDQFVSMLLDIWNVACQIVGSYTDRSEFSPSKQILFFNLKLDIFIPHSSESTFVKQK